MGAFRTCPWMPQRPKTHGTGPSGATDILPLPAEDQQLDRRGSANGQGLLLRGSELDSMHCTRCILRDHSAVARVESIARTSARDFATHRWQSNVHRVRARLRGGFATRKQNGFGSAPTFADNARCTQAGDRRSGSAFPMSSTLTHRTRTAPHHHSTAAPATALPDPRLEATRYMRCLRIVDSTPTRSDHQTSINSFVAPTCLLHKRSGHPHCPICSGSPSPHQHRCYHAAQHCAPVHHHQEPS